MTRSVLTFVSLLALAACGEGASAGDPAAMNAAIRALMARPEHTSPDVQVQHLLVAFQGSGIPKATRTKQEAEALAAKLWGEAMAGADFDALVKQHTDDSYPGTYSMNGMTRRQMVAAFGDVGWRLHTGEIGVARHEPQSSPYGWHIVKRLK